jgi:hypothetical protein
MWVAKLLEFRPNNKVLVQWTENPAHLPSKAQAKNRFGKHEILMTFDEKNKTEIDTNTLAGDVTVYENSADPGTKDFWWNRFWDKGQVTDVCKATEIFYDDDDDYTESHQDGNTLMIID